jgi:hypothetical protein
VALRKFASTYSFATIMERDNSHVVGWKGVAEDNDCSLASEPTPYPLPS